MADTVLTELKIHDFDLLEQMSQYESEIGEYDLVFTPDMSAKLFLFKHAWADYLVSDMSWLRADTFSWHSGDKYKTAYNHLTNDMRTVYAWVDRAGSYGFNIYTESATPSVGDSIYDENGSVIGSCSSFDSGSLGWTGSDGTTYSAWRRSVSDDLPSARTETIGNITITYYLAQDGHKICLPDQESNIVALYEATGVAWYYLLDQTNQQFKLPRTKYGFTGLRDSVGGYVAPAVPNITAGFRTGSWKTDAVSASTSGAATQTVGGSTKAYEGGSNAYTYVDTTIDASASDPAYQDGATVQPPATQMYLYFYVGNFEQSAVEQTAGLNAEMFNGKVDVDLNNINPSNSAKAMIVGWGMPDYSSGIGFSNNTDYTAPSDGFVLASGWTNTSTNSYFNLNGTRMADFICNTSAWLPALVYCPVHKGDVIRINFTQVKSTMNFYPLKGV